MFRYRWLPGLTLALFACLLMFCGDDRVVNRYIETSITWQKSYQVGLGSSLNDVCECNDGGLIWVGYTQTENLNATAGNQTDFTTYDLLLLKISYLGDTAWVKVITDSLSEELGRRVLPASDGGYIVASTNMDRSGFMSDTRLRKITECGELIWTVDHDIAEYESISSIAVTHDGGYVLTGQADFDGFSLKVTRSGEFDWATTCGTTAPEAFHGAALLPNGSYMAAGWTALDDPNHTDAYLVKLSAAGDSLWATTIDLGGWEEARAIVPLDNSGFLLYGYAYIAGRAVFAVRTDSLGVPDSAITHHVDNGFLLHTVEPTEDNGATFVGVRHRDDGASGYLIKLNSGNSIEWQRAYGVEGYSIWLNCAAELKGGGYAVAGYISGSTFLMRTDHNGYAKPLVMPDSL